MTDNMAHPRMPLNIPLRFNYTKPYGQPEPRYAVFTGFVYMSNFWYSEEQWFLDGWDCDADEPRIFAYAAIDLVSVCRAEPPPKGPTRYGQNIQRA